MTRTREEILESRHRLRSEYGALFDSVSALFYRHDPKGINFGDNPDEYDLEAETILPRLRGCQGADDVHKVVHSEFVRCFDADTVGPPDRYTQISSELWQVWQKHLANRPVSG
jgi:hypothetical protein